MRAAWRWSGVGVAIGLALALVGGETTALAGVPVPDAAQPSAWSAPLKLKGGFFTSVAAALDSNGKIHIAATERDKGLFYLTNRGGGWHSRRLLANPWNDQYDIPAKAYEQASITVDQNNRVHIAVTRSHCADCAPGSYDGIFYLSDKGRARGTFPAHGTRITPTGMVAPSLRALGNRLYLAYAKCACLPEQSVAPLWYATRTSGDWTHVKIARYGQDPSLRVGTDGYARIAFIGTSGLRLATFDMGGFSRSSVPGTNINDYLPSLALDAANRPVLAWIRAASSEANSGTRYIKRSAGGWTATKVVRHGYTQGVSLALDDQDRPHIVMGDVGVREARLVGGSFVTTIVDSDASISSAVIREPASGRALIVYAAVYGDPHGIYVSRN